jgi:broad specificity phosphatase PhoE
MKTIYLMRHSIKTGTGNSGLSIEGIKLAKEIGSSKLRDKHFTHLFVSPLSRTTDTLNSLSDGAGDFPKQRYEIFPLQTVSSSDDGMKLWEGVCHEAEINGGDMMEAALREDSKRAEKIANKGAKAFNEWIKSLPENSTALVVNHSPFLELIAYGLFGDAIPQLQPCEGFRVLSKDGALTFENSI